MVSIRAIDLYLSWWQPGSPDPWPAWGTLSQLQYLDLSWGNGAGTFAGG